MSKLFLSGYLEPIKKWLPAITFTIRNMQNRNVYFDIIYLLWLFNMHYWLFG